jgi:pimeloyl-ACP methyl ester carboxylesterase
MTARWRRRLVGGLGLAGLATAVALRRWKRDRLDALAAETDLVETDRGVVEVARRGSGTPVLLLHGAPGGYDQGLALGTATFGDDADLVVPSRPGYLRTPLGDGEGHPSEQAALFDALLDELDIEEAVVVGLSAGGPAALHLAAEYPERVAGLVLASAVTTDLDERQFDTGNVLVDAVRSSTPALDLRSGWYALAAAFAPDETIEQLHGLMSSLEGEELEEYVEFVRTTPEHRRRALEFFPTFLPVSARIEGVRADEHWNRRLPLVDYGDVACPTLVVHGEHDGVVPMAHAEFVAERVEDADLRTVETDHLAWIGPDADRAGEYVRRFVESVAPTPESAQ